MVSIRHYIDLVESAFSQHAYKHVITPAGKGSVIKINGDNVFVMMDGGNEVKQFKPYEIKDAPRVDRRSEPRPDYHFSAKQMAAGRNTRMIEHT